MTHVSRVAQPSREQASVEDHSPADAGRHHHADEVLDIPWPRRPIPRRGPTPWRRCRRRSATGQLGHPAAEGKPAPARDVERRHLLAPRAHRSAAAHAADRQAVPRSDPTQHLADQPGQVGPEFLARRRRRLRRHLGPLRQHPGLGDQAAGQLGAPDVDGQCQICHESRDYGAHAGAHATRATDPPRTRKSPAGKGGAHHTIRPVIPPGGGSESGTSHGHRSPRPQSRSAPLRPVPPPRPWPAGCRATRPCPCDAGCARTRRRRRT